MTDYGLVASVLAAFVVTSIIERAWWPLTTTFGDAGFTDVVLGPAAVGLLVGRLVTVMIDDPGSIGRLSDVLVIRSGVEFWPGVLAAALAAGWSAKRTGTRVVERVADVAPLAMIAYGVYEVSCLARGGCYGPSSSIGIRPRGLSTTMVPVGLGLGLVVATGAAFVHAISRRHWAPGSTLLLATWIVSTSRSVASFWLPRLGSTPTRQHLTSLAVSVTTTVALVGCGAARTRRMRTAT